MSGFVRYAHGKRNHVMTPAENGPFVRACDYDTLRAQLEAAEARAEDAEAECARLREDAERLDWLWEESGIEGFTNVAGDIHDFAQDEADDNDRDEANRDDYCAAMRKLIDAARTKEQQA